MTRKFTIGISLIRACFGVNGSLVVIGDCTEVHIRPKKHVRHSSQLIQFSFFHIAEVLKIVVIRCHKPKKSPQTTTVIRKSKKIGKVTP